MAIIKIRYMVSRKNSDGATRHYWQPSTQMLKDGFAPQRLPDSLDAAIEMANRLNDAVAAWRRGAPVPEIEGQHTRLHPRAGTVDALIRLFATSERFQRLAPSTKRGYLQSLGVISKWAGDAPVESLTRRVILDFYRVMSRRAPAYAGAVMRVMRLLLQTGVDNEWIDANPAVKLGIKTQKPRATLWPEGAVERFVELADKMGQGGVGTAVLLAVCLGQRQGDILRLTWASWKDGAFRIRQGKTGRWVEIPAMQSLQDRLASQPRSAMQIVASPTGLPWTARNFMRAFHKVRRAASQSWPEYGFDNLWFLDLRRTAVVRMAEAGCTEFQIAAVTGHQIESTRRILETYLPRTSEMAAAAIRLREAKESTITPFKQRREA